MACVQKSTQKKLLSVAQTVLSHSPHTPKRCFHLRLKSPDTGHDADSYYIQQGLAVGMNRHSNRHTPQREVQVAFKVLMTHWILQFAWRIAFRCVLHRCGSQDIHWTKCYFVILSRQLLPKEETHLLQSVHNQLDLNTPPQQSRVDIFKMLSSIKDSKNTTLGRPRPVRNV